MRERRWGDADEVAEHGSNEAAPGMGADVGGAGWRGIEPLPDPEPVEWEGSGEEDESSGEGGFSGEVRRGAPASRISGGVEGRARWGRALDPDRGREWEQGEWGIG